MRSRFLPPLTQVRPVERGKGEQKHEATTVGAPALAEVVEEAEAEAARKGFKEKNKQKTQRAGAPIFEIIVELRRGMYHEWIITTDSGKAVDDILDGKKYIVQRRSRDADTGAFHVRMDRL